MKTAPAPESAPAADTEAITPDEQSQLDEMRDAPAETGGESAPATDAPADAGVDGEPPAAEPGKPRQQMVPHAALHEARSLLKEERDRNKILEERTNLILQRFNQPATPAPAAPTIEEVPDLEKDPVGHIVGKQQMHTRALEQIARLLQGENQRQQQSTQISNLQNQAIALENEYKSTVPDYDEAVAHLADMRDKELRLAGFSNPAERRQIVGQEALGVAARAMQQGKNPAEMIYELAKLRGHTTAAPVEKDDAAGEKISNIAAGQQQRRSLGATRGSGPAPLTASRLLELSDADFLKMLDKSEGKDLMGH